MPTWLCVPYSPIPHPYPACQGGDVLLFVCDGVTSVGSTPSFTTVVVTAALTVPNSARGEHINDDDGCMDVVSGSDSDGSIAWFRSNCATMPSFTQHVIVTGAAGGKSDALTTADLNVDGAADVISVSPSAVTYYLSSGGSTPTFSSHVLTTAAANSIVTVVDVNGDGYVDIVVPANNGAIRWFQSDGALLPTFSLRTISGSSASVSFMVAPLDFDDDGDVDLAVTCPVGGTVTVYVSSGGRGPSFTAAVVFQSSSVSPWGIATGDFDGDGNADLVTADDSGVWWHRNTGVASVFDVHPVDSMTLAARVATADLDGDGVVDIAGVAYIPAGGVGVVWYHNTACQAGQYSGNGSEPCTPCPPGTFGSGIALTSSSCSGYCLAGNYSSGGAVACTMRRAGYYVDTKGLQAPRSKACVHTSPIGHGTRTIIARHPSHLRTHSAWHTFANHWLYSGTSA